MENVSFFKLPINTISSQINSTCDIFSTSLRKDYLVKGIENAWKQIKVHTSLTLIHASYSLITNCVLKQEVKPKEALNEIVLITFNWENKGGMALKQLFGNELLKQDLSLSIQVSVEPGAQKFQLVKIFTFKVIDLCCSVKFNATEEWLCVRSFQPLNFDLEVEAFFKVSKNSA